MPQPVGPLDVILLVAIVGMILAALLVAYLLRPVQSELVENPNPALEPA